MRAVVLVGGEGTRMRPLTETIPKPLIPLVDRPFLDHVLDHLTANGVREVLLSSPYLESAFEAFLAARHGEPLVSWFTETQPLGTGGAVANAVRDLQETLLVLNGDILTDLDLTALVRSHRERGAAVSITLVPVEDARPFGLVATDETGRVEEFREKPSELVPGWINAGTYVIDARVLQEVPVGVPVSIEREVFPNLIARGLPVFGYRSEDYWMDLGTPRKYLRATFDALEGRIRGLSYPAPFVAPGAEVSLRSQLGRWVVVGPGAVVEEGAEVEDSVLLAGARVGASARVRDSILGPRSRVGSGATVDGAVLAELAQVPVGAVSTGARVGARQVLEA